ncbi:hypothetical protein Agub_g9795, partial [Astrephomene gubernaculifera]
MKRQLGHAEQAGPAKKRAFCPPLVSRTSLHQGPSALPAANAAQTTLPEVSTAPSCVPALAKASPAVAPNRLAFRPPGQLRKPASSSGGAKQHPTLKPAPASAPSPPASIAALGVATSAATKRASASVQKAAVQSNFSKPPPPEAAQHAVRSRRPLAQPSPIGYKASGLRRPLAPAQVAQSRPLAPVNSSTPTPGGATASHAAGKAAAAVPGPSPASPAARRLDGSPAAALNSASQRQESIQAEQPDTAAQQHEPLSLHINTDLQAENGGDPDAAAEAPRGSQQPASHAATAPSAESHAVTAPPVASPVPLAAAAAAVTDVPSCPGDLETKPTGT